MLLKMLWQSFSPVLHLTADLLGGLLHRPLTRLPRPWFSFSFDVESAVFMFIIFLLMK